MKTIEEFFAGGHSYDLLGADRDWAMANCRDMQEVWETLRPEWLVWLATQQGVLTVRELRRFAVWSARQIQHLAADPRSLTAIDVAERHANGMASDWELGRAMGPAMGAARGIEGCMTFQPPFSEMWLKGWAMKAAAWAAWLDPHMAASSTARAAVFGTDAERHAARAAQAAWLRANTKPCWD